MSTPTAASDKVSSSNSNSAPEKPKQADDSKAVFMVQAALMVLVAVVTWVTYVYCSSVYYDRESAFHNVLECTERVLSDEGMEHWLQNGTLLGATRLGRLVLWDADLDFGVLNSPSLELGSIGGRLDDLCFGHTSTVRDGAVQPELRVWRKCTRRICAEFHEAVLSADKNTVRSGDGTSSTANLFPLNSCTVANVGTKCPHNSAFFLAQAYGGDWLTRPLTKLF